jgi:hypothetical protein
VDLYRLVMLNVSQSVALDHYAEVSRQDWWMRPACRRSTLEKQGKLNISGKNG